VDRAGARLLSGTCAPARCAARRALCKAATTLCAALLLAGPLAAQDSDAWRVQIVAAIPAAAAATRGASPEHGGAQALQAVHARNAGTPLWIRDGRATAQAVSLVHELQRAASYGLEPDDYAAAELARSAAALAAATATDPTLATRFEVGLSAAALHLLSDLHYGRVDPAAAGFHLQGVHAPLDLAAALESLAGAHDVTTVLTGSSRPSTTTSF
jgi:murein L,D-transpeptidase YcbB/YkuD